MIYRNSAYANSDLDARARLIELAHKGGAIRTEVARRRADRHRRQAAKQRALDRARSEKEALAARRHAQRLRVQAVSRFGIASWSSAAFMSLMLLTMVGGFSPLFIFALGMSVPGILAVAAFALLPLAVPPLQQALAERALNAEISWAEQRKPAIAGHGDALGKRVGETAIRIDLKNDAPDPSLVADVMAAVSTRLPRKVGACLAGTEVTADGRSLSIKHSSLSAPHGYRTWVHAIVDHVLPELETVYPLRGISVRTEA